LLELLVSSTERQLAGLPGDGVLMMSSGKDSVAVAIALAELGVHTPSVTFKAAGDDTEHMVAARICRRLGLDHRTVEMPADSAITQANLVRFFEDSPSPTADHAAIAYVASLAATGISEGGCLDGGGNDPYMGYLVSDASRTKLRYRIRGRRAASAIKRVIPVDSPVNYLARSKAGALLPGRNPRFRETTLFYPEVLDTESFWYRQGRLAADQGLEGELTVSRLRHTETSRSNLKSRLAARAQGLSLVLPFCDSGLADYYFHLPESARFDRAAGTNKLLLRQLLDEKIGYDPAVVGDGYFRFDGPAFMTAHAAFVRDEIFSCTLWRPSVRAMIDSWLDSIPQRPFLWHAVLPVFMLSGWHNHSRFVAA
jgi:asparagine synthetase B (glutamine-hydrolysing)